MEQKSNSEPQNVDAERSAVSSTDGLDAETVRAAIEAEPELPGDMPEQIWAAVQKDRDAAVELLRIVVRLTKEGITKRLGLEASNVKVSHSGPASGVN